MESEYADRMRPFVFLEIRFAAAACELSKEQRQLIAKRAKPMIDELAKELAKQEPEKEGHTKAIANGGLDPQRRVLETLAAIIRNQVSSERWERYQREVQKRAAHRKRSTIDNLVAALDRDLILSQKERQALAGVLLDEWKEEWSWNTEILVDFEAWLPLISHQRIASILSETQRKALKNRSVRAPNPWEIFVLAAEIFEFTRTAEEEEIENASGFAADRR